jgi:tetratricopeptide (TPR) repeat protein
MPDTPDTAPGQLAEDRTSVSPATHLSALWRQAPGPDLGAFLEQAGPLSAEQLAAVLGIDQRQRWLRGERPPAEDYLRLYASRHTDPTFAVDLLFGEFRIRRQRGETPSLDEYRQRFPDLAEQLVIQVKLSDALASGGPPSTGPPVSVGGQTPGGAAASATALPGGLGRYVLLEEIGRGGMGCVLRGHDPDLGRDLAVKVLLPDHQHDPAVLHRFTEEAQIGGQLQHPSIVPVYEVGRSADHRPYFTMKLVQGRTLAALLAERPGLHQERSRFLQIFEQVCQALAYAHSKGVIHRDLKPANVMVGEFGEVQVMDWGLAKVLASGGRQPPVERETKSETPHTRAGTVLGTPAYMAPEQAAGATGQLDERCDVFGLGAILCEILTGRPPYCGSDGKQVLRKAVRADLVEALCRLDACGADAELVDLAKVCLCAERDGRPRDAGVVAGRVQAHLAAVQERLRQAELERARAVTRAESESRQRQAAQAQARAERRARRLTVGLAGAGLLLVVLGGGAALYVGQQRAERDLRAARAETDLGEYDKHISEVRPEEALAQKEELDLAQKALERAESRLDGSAPEELKDRLRQARADLDRLRKEEGMLGRLEEARLQFASVGPRKALNRAGADRLYGEAFAWYGIDVEHLSPGEAARRLVASALREQLVDSLDFWGRVAANQTRKAQRQKAVRLRTLADVVDTSTWRRRLRRAVAQADTRAARHLAEQAMRATLPVARAVMLANGLVELKLHNEAVEVLEQAMRSHPADFWVYYSLGYACFDSTPPRREDAVRYYTAAVALRPKSAKAYIHLGAALAAVNKLPEAVLTYRRAIRLARDDPNAYYNLGIALAARNKLPQAEAAYREAIRLKPEDPDAHNNLGNVLASQNKLAQAEAFFRKAIRLKADHHLAHTNLGSVLRHQNRFADAEAACREALRHKPDDPEAHNSLGIALAARNKLTEAVAAYREAIRLKPDYADAHNNLGSALVAQKKLTEAEAAFREAIRLKPELHQAHCNLGNALGLQNKVAQAADAYREAIRLKPDDAQAHYGLGVALQAQNKPAQALLAYKEAIRLKPDFAQAHINLGNILQAQNKLADAEAAFRKAIRLKPTYFGVHYNLGNTLQAQNKLAQAEAAFREAIRFNPNFPQAHCNLGSALQGQGKFAESLAAYRRGHEVGLKTPGWRYPSAVWVRQARRLVELDEKLPAVLEGDTKPKNADEQIELARLCSLKRWHAVSARFYADAFAAAPALMDGKAAHRYSAACAAALAGCGRSEGPVKLDDRQRADLRRQALGWLRDEVPAWTGRIDRGSANDRAVVRRLIEHSRTDPDLAGVRDRDALGKLAEKERQQWQKLWAEVAELQKKGQQK